MAKSKNRRNEAGWVATWIHRGRTDVALHDIPAVVAAHANEIDLLHPILADVRQPECAAACIERKSPRIAQPERPNLRTIARLFDKRIVRRHAIGPHTSGAIDI